MLRVLSIRTHHVIISVSTMVLYNKIDGTNFELNTVSIRHDVSRWLAVLGHLSQIYYPSISLMEMTFTLTFGLTTQQVAQRSYHISPFYKSTSSLSQFYVSIASWPSAHLHMYEMSQKHHLIYDLILIQIAMTFTKYIYTTKAQKEDISV